MASVIIRPKKNRNVGKISTVGSISSYLGEAYSLTRSSKCFKIPGLLSSTGSFSTGSSGSDISEKTMPSQHVSISFTILSAFFSVTQPSITKALSVFAKFEYISARSRSIKRSSRSPLSFDRHCAAAFPIASLHFSCSKFISLILESISDITEVGVPFRLPGFILSTSHLRRSDKTSSSSFKREMTSMQDSVSDTAFSAKKHMPPAAVSISAFNGKKSFFGAIPITALTKGPDPRVSTDSSREVIFFNTSS